MAEIISREPLFETSTIVAYDNTPFNLDKSHRDSWTAFFPRPDPETNPDDRVVRCIEKRAAAFQGHVPIENVEFLQVVKYSPSF
jgi:prolyl 4-hydroxylase